MLRTGRVCVGVSRVCSCEDYFATHIPPYMQRGIERRSEQRNHRHAGRRRASRLERAMGLARCALQSSKLFDGRWVASTSAMLVVYAPVALFGTRTSHATPGLPPPLATSHETPGQARCPGRLLPRPQTGKHQHLTSPHGNARRLSACVPAVAHHWPAAARHSS